MFIPDEFEDYPDLIESPPLHDEIESEWPDASRELIDRCYELISDGVTRGAHYWMMRLRGSSDKFAAMIALQAGPALNTDDTFFQGQKPLYDQFGSQRHLNRYLKEAKKRGFTPSVNSTYFPSLARFPGDPEAFVTRSQGRSYIKKLCESRGWACEGGVNVEHRQPEEDPLDAKNCKVMGEDIIRNRAAQMVKEDPSLKRMSRTELRQKIIDKHGPSK